MTNFGWVADEEDRRKLKRLWVNQDPSYNKVHQKICAKQFGWRGQTAYGAREYLEIRQQINTTYHESY